MTMMPTGNNNNNKEKKIPPLSGYFFQSDLSSAGLELMSLLLARLNTTGSGSITELENIISDGNRFRLYNQSLLLITQMDRSCQETITIP